MIWGSWGQGESVERKAVVIHNIFPGGMKMWKRVLTARKHDPGQQTPADVAVGVGMLCTGGLCRSQPRTPQRAVSHRDLELRGAQ